MAHDRERGRDAAARPRVVPVGRRRVVPDLLQAHTAKLRNIAVRPRVSLHLDGNGQGGDIVAVLGNAAVANDPPAHEIPAYVDKYGAFIARNTWTPESFAADYSVPLRITATGLRGW